MAYNAGLYRLFLSLANFLNNKSKTFFIELIKKAHCESGDNRQAAWPKKYQLTQAK